MIVDRFNKNVVLCSEKNMYVVRDGSRKVETKDVAHERRLPRNAERCP